jgi:AcrR family transcriptional regulator
VTVAAGGKRERTKQANRAQILAAAREVFADIGYGAASVRDIVRRTDLATGTFYNYFPDKETVFAALLDDAAVRGRERTRAGRSGARTLEEFVRGGYRAYFEFLAEDTLTFDLLRRNEGTIRTLFDTPALGAGVEELQADLDAAVAQGILPAHDTEYMAAAMVGVGFEVGVRMVERDPPDVDGAADLATAVFVGGLERLAA